MGWFGCLDFFPPLCVSAGESQRTGTSSEADFGLISPPPLQV